MLIDDDLKAVQKNFKKLSKAVKNDYVPKRRFNKLINVVQKMSLNLEIQNSALVHKSIELRETAKELRKARRSERKLAKYEYREARAVVSTKKASKKAKSAKKPKRSKRKSGPPGRVGAFLGNFLIVIAFISLIAAIGFFIGGLTGVTDTLAIAAVVCFIVGIIVRVVSAVRAS